MSSASTLVKLKTIGRQMPEGTVLHVYFQADEQPVSAASVRYRNEEYFVMTRAQKGKEHIECRVIIQACHVDACS